MTFSDSFGHPNLEKMALGKFSPKFPPNFAEIISLRTSAGCLWGASIFAWPERMPFAEEHVVFQLPTLVMQKTWLSTA